MKGYELIKTITERKIKNNTTIKVKMGNAYKATLKYENFMLKWESGDFDTSILCSTEADFEVIEENKEIRELPHGTYLELKNGSTIGSRTKDHYNIENILNGIRIDLKIHQDKINELVQAVNKINKESDK